MSLWADYLRERLGKSVLETDAGFATYQFLKFNGDDACYIEDIYVNAEGRNKHHASDMATFIAEEAKERGCTTLLGSVAPSAKGSTASLKVLLSYGFELSHWDAQNNLIIFTKRLDK